VILYLDTSAVVKLYVEEAGSQEVKEAVSESRIVSTSRVAYVEGMSAIARKYREGEFSKEEYEQVVGDLDRDWDNYFIIEVSEGVAKLGGELTSRHPLRGFDAIHLASALLLQSRSRMEVSFSCFDERLEVAAKAEGLMVESCNSGDR